MSVIRKSAIVVAILGLIVIGFLVWRTRPKETDTVTPTTPNSPFQLRDVTSTTGIDFVHTDGSSGRRYIIDKIDSRDPVVQRLMVLGLVEGTEIELASSAIGGDPIAVGTERRLPNAVFMTAKYQWFADAGHVVHPAGTISRRSHDASAVGTELRRVD